MWLGPYRPTDASPPAQTPSALIAATAVNTNVNFFSANLSVDNPDYRVPAFAPDVYTNLNRKLVTRVDVNGGFLRQQVTTLNNRLIAVAGTRVDNVTFNFWGNKQASPCLGYASRRMNTEPN